MASPDHNIPQHEPNERSKLASRLKDAREYLGFSQEQVARHLGIARSALSNIENGQRKVDVVELKKLAALYKKPVSYFTDEPDPVVAAIPEDLEILARKASKLSPKDRAELARFADFLGSQSAKSGGSAAEEK